MFSHFRHPLAKDFLLFILVAMIVSPYLLLGFGFTRKQNTKVSKRHMNPLEASYRHLLETPQHDFPLEVEDSALNEYGDNLVQTRAELKEWSLEDAMENEIELDSD